MKQLIILLLGCLFPLTSFAVKLNQRGEKMVSEIRVTYPTESQSPYTIKLGYDDKGEINSLVFECDNDYTHQFFEAKMQRGSDGSITMNDFINGKLVNRYTFQIDSQKRPTEMVWYEKNIYGKFVKVFTFQYYYNFQDFNLSIVSSEDCETAASRESVKFVDDNDYVYWNIINLENGRESASRKKYKNVAYSSYDNDLNVDLSQIIMQFCGVGDSFYGWVRHNFLILTQWVPVKPPKMLSTIDIDRMEYNYDGEILRSIDVKYFYTGKPHYTISLSYIE